MDNNLLQSLSDDQIEEALVKYKGVPSVVTLLNGIKEVRLADRARAQEAMEVEAEQAQAKARFESGIAKLFAKLPHPDDIHNVYIHWGKVKVTDGEPEEVEVVQADGSKVMEMRSPSHEEEAWIVETNHVTRGSQATTTTTPTTSKRAITVFKHNADGADEDKGNYGSASKACEALGLVIGGDSATRVLTREGYYTVAYNGTEYTS